LLCGSIAVAASPALAADTLKFGATPGWVVPQAIPAPSAEAKDRPLAILLHDQQTMLEPGKTTTYSELAIKIQKPEALSSVGNVSVAWDPTSDAVTVNRLEIRRGDQIIDVLKSGQSFTTMRRESNLDLATLDGVLTANIQPEGLQEGDILVLASTTEHSDPVFKGHVETTFAPWASAEIGLAHARIQWAPSLSVHIQKAGDLPPAQEGVRDGKRVYELTMRDVEPVIVPKSAPLRFRIGRMGEASDFRSWAEAARVMLPLYQTAAVVPASGPLRDEVRKISTASADPKVRAEMALRLVEQRVRYVALLMGQGGYVPVSAETTWSRRFGDCKAKTALLLAILHELGIAAEPVAVNPLIGDAVADRLPSFGLFNHVLVRAHIGGKDYWLDGTRTGDTSLDRIRVPDFGWGLPLIDNAALVHILPPPLEVPDSESKIDVDATAGIYAPAKITIDELYRGDGAVAFNTSYAQLSADQRTEYMRKNARDYFDGMTVDSSSVQFDKATGELRILTKGTAKLDWKDGWFSVPNASIAYNPDFDRPAGSLQQVPFATSYPDYDRRTATIHVPPDFTSTSKSLPNAVHETLAGVDYQRMVTVAPGSIRVESSERSLVPEVPYKMALAAAARLKALSDDDVYLHIPRAYRYSAADLAARGAQTLTSADDYLERGNAYLDARKFDESIADFTAVLKLDQKNVWALADRALAYVYKKDFAGAAKDIAAAEAIDPRNAVLWRAKAVRAEAQEDLPSAYAFYTRSLELEPQNTFALYQRARVSMSQHKAADALRDINEILSRFPENADVLALRATIYSNMGKRVEARKDVDAAKAIKPNAPSVGNAEAAIAHSDNDYEAQVATFSNLLAANAQNPVALVSRGQAYFKLERYDDALADTDQALKLGYHWPDVRVLRANVFMMRHDREAVTREAEAMVRENPDSDFAFVAAGKTYNALGRKQDAMKAFDHALAIKPQAYVYINRSQVRPYSDSQGRIADLDAALKLDPDSVDALSIKAWELARAKDYAAALALYDRAVALQPEDNDLPRSRASVLYKAGRTAEAERTFATLRAAAKTPDDFNSICATEARLDAVMLEHALQDCEAALKLQAKYSAAIGNIALIELRMGKYDAAIAHYTQVVANQPSADHYFGRAIAYAREGDIAKAAADRAEALKLNADVELRFAEYGLKM
jgi:tetratricopeptide (TPR) repeat protein